MSFSTAITVLRRHRRICRVCFGVYALFIIGATHWPRLVVPGAQVNSDKVVHAGAYFFWTLLAFGAGFFGPALSRQNVQRTALLALIYSVLDETSQLIPVFGREASLWDATANAVGVGMAYALTMMIIRPTTEEPENLP